MEGGNLGLADFSGNLISDDRESTTRAVSNGSGNFSVLTGPFASVGGAWGGTYRAQTTSDAIPALGVPGLVLLALFLIGLSAYLLQRQKRPL